MNEAYTEEYADGYETASHDIQEEGIGYAERHASNMSGTSLYAIGYRSAVSVYRERQTQ